METAYRYLLPVHLLVPYLAAATHRVAEGKSLRTRDRAAIEVALSQLETEYTALTGAAITPGAQRAALVGPESPSIEFASAVLNAISSQWGQRNTPDSRLVALSDLQDLLRRTERGEGEAAEKASRVFDAAVDDLFFDRSPLSLPTT